MTQSDIPEIERRQNDEDSGNQKGNGYFWNTDTLAWEKLSGDNNGILIQI